MTLGDLIEMLKTNGGDMDKPVFIDRRSRESFKVKEVSTSPTRHATWVELDYDEDNEEEAHS